MREIDDMIIDREMETAFSKARKLMKTAHGIEIVFMLSAMEMLCKSAREESYLLGKNMDQIESRYEVKANLKRE